MLHNVVVLDCKIMACYKPLTAYQCADRSIIWRELPGADVVRTLQLPCGQCVGCRLERSRQWAIRCMHEAQMHTSIVLLL